MRYAISAMLAMFLTISSAQAQMAPPCPPENRVRMSDLAPYDQNLIHMAIEDLYHRVIGEHIDTIEDSQHPLEVEKRLETTFGKSQVVLTRTAIFSAFEETARTHATLLGESLNLSMSDSTGGTRRTLKISQAFVSVRPSEVRFGYAIATIVPSWICVTEHNRDEEPRPVQPVRKFQA